MSDQTLTIGECEGCHQLDATLHSYEAPYAHLSAYTPPDPTSSPHRPLLSQRPPARLLCADCYNAAQMAAEDRLHRAAPNLLRIAQLILVRLDLAAAEGEPGAPFLCAALRPDLRTAIAQAIGEEGYQPPWRGWHLHTAAAALARYMPTSVHSRTLNPLLRGLPAGYTFGELADAVAGAFDESPLQALPNFGPRRYTYLQAAIAEFMRAPIEVLP